MRKKFSHDLIVLSVWNKIDFNQYEGNGYQSTRSVPRKCYYGIKLQTLQYHPRETPVPVKLHKKWY